MNKKSISYLISKVFTRSCARYIKATLAVVVLLSGICPLQVHAAAARQRNVAARARARGRQQPAMAPRRLPKGAVIKRGGQAAKAQVNRNNRRDAARIVRQVTQRQAAQRQAAPRPAVPRQAAPRQAAPRQAAPRQAAPRGRRQQPVRARQPQRAPAAARRAEVARREAERVRLENERREVERVRLENERREVERVRLENERREAERVRIEREAAARREAERVRLENERRAAQELEQRRQRERQEAVRREAERVRIEREAAAHREAERVRLENERRAAQDLERRRQRERQEAARREAERVRIERERIAQENGRRQEEQMQQADRDIAREREERERGRDERNALRAHPRRRIEQAVAVEGQAALACAACMEDADDNAEIRLIKLGCDHIVCQDCFHRITRENGLAGIGRLLCPVLGCRASFAFDLAESRNKDFIFGDNLELRNNYQQLIERLFLHDQQDYRACPRGGCGGGAWVNEAHAARAHEVRCEGEQCQGRNFRFCTGCLQEAHHPQNCAQARVDRAAPVALPDNIRRCPNCNNGVERNGGCNFVQCRCRTLFCWFCLNAMPGEIPHRCADGQMLNAFTFLPTLEAVRAEEAERRRGGFGGFHFW